MKLNNSLLTFARGYILAHKLLLLLLLLLLLVLFYFIFLNFFSKQMKRKRQERDKKRKKEWHQSDKPEATDNPAVVQSSI